MHKVANKPAARVCRLLGLRNNVFSKDPSVTSIIPQRLTRAASLIVLIQSLLLPHLIFAMFGLPGWGPDPIADIIASRYGRQPPRSKYSPLPESFGSPHHPRCSARNHQYPKAYHKASSKPNKYTRFPDLDTPSTSDFSSSEWEESYTPDTDDDRDKYRPPPFPPLRKRAVDSPDIRRVSVKLPTSTAEDLTPDEILLLPELIHLHIRVRINHTQNEQVLRVAVPGSMRLGDLVQQVIGDNMRERGVTASVKRRGRWDEPSSSARIEDLKDRGEVFRERRREMEVKIEIGDDGSDVFERMHVGGRGPRGGRGIEKERVWRRKTEESRVKMRT